MTNFNIQIAVARVSQNLGSFDDPGIDATYSTNSVVDFTDYLSNAMDYHKSMVRFDSDVLYVSILVRTYRDHHTVIIQLENGSGPLQVRTNQ